MAKSAMDEEIDFPSAGEFIVQMKGRFEKISAYYDELKEKATPAMDRVRRTYTQTSIFSTLAVVVALLALLLDGVDTSLLALVLGLSLSYVLFSIFTALSGLCPLHRPIRDGAVMEHEFLSDLKAFRDSERARLDLDGTETHELQMLQFVPHFAHLNHVGYQTIFASVLLAFSMFMVAAILVFSTEMMSLHLDGNS